MKNAENVRELLHAMSSFGTAYDCLRAAIEKYEQDTGATVNDLPGFTSGYPFDTSFDELAVDLWVTNVIDKVRQSAFKVLRHQYINTGGNTRVSVFDVWLPEMKRVVYALTNEEGCTLSYVDYLSNDLEIDDYDELLIESVDWGRMTGYETHFELYRHCLNEFNKRDCQYYGFTRFLPRFLLSDDLQQQITDEYNQWVEAEVNGHFETDGMRVIISDTYKSTHDTDKPLAAIKKFRRWHSSIAAREEYYDEKYKLELAGHKVELPFYAETWDAIDCLLKRTIEDW